MKTMKTNFINPFKALAKVFTLFAMVFGLVFITSCGDDEPGTDEEEPTESLAVIIEGEATYSDFAFFYDLYSDLLPDISGETEYTVFVPNDAAFDKLRTTLGVDDLTTIKADVIASVLAFHFVPGTTSEIAAGSSLTTAQGEQIKVNADGTIHSGGSDDAVEILKSERATNGILYETETILIPPTIFASIVTHLGKVSQPLLLGGSFSILAKAIMKADAYAAQTTGVTPLSEMLANGDNNLTVFAPTDATFHAAAGVEEGDDAATIEAKVNGFLDAFSGQQFYGIISNHIVLDDGNDQDDNALVEDEELVTGASLQTAFTVDGTNFGSLTVFNNTEAIPAKNGIGVYLDSNGDVDLQAPATYTNFDAEVAASPNTTGLTAANGSIYVIAGILSPLPPSED